MGMLFNCEIYTLDYGVIYSKSFVFDIDDIANIERRDHVYYRQDPTKDPSAPSYTDTYWKVIFSRTDMSTIKPRGFFESLFSSPSIDEQVQFEGPRVYGGGNEANYIYIDDDDYKRLVKVLKRMGRFA